MYFWIEAGSVAYMHPRPYCLPLWSLMVYVTVLVMMVQWELKPWSKLDWLIKIK
jgi:hypothetical protein